MFATGRPFFWGAFTGLEVTSFSAWAWTLVGAGLLAMVVNDNAHDPDTRSALESIASKPAPTVWRSHHFDPDAIPCRSWLASDGRQRLRA
ncbi:hypothetical protein EI969_12945 [Pseudomonas sp. PB101]|nr:hypothetical protein [Pseudomonas sp. PB101]